MHCGGIIVCTVFIFLFRWCLINLQISVLPYDSELSKLDYVDLIFDRRKRNI